MDTQKTILRAALRNLIMMHRIMGKFLKQLMLYMEKQGDDMP